MRWVSRRWGAKNFGQWSADLAKLRFAAESDVGSNRDHVALFELNSGKKKKRVPRGSRSAHSLL